ncbi:hypothetical protein L7F22_048648 [Adiantum nelumboides]|nr:hypothetical protein [Adiantum nelumboides]
MVVNRRWTICSRIESVFPYQITENLLQQELKLVAMIADRSRMNFQAWQHCCWLVQWMSPVQMLHELQTWKRWAELHVAENSCFHFRRCLFEKLLTDEDNSLRMKAVWLEELEWNKKLIKLYIGREALWLHQRFLFFLWVHHFKRTDSAGSIEHPFPLAEISFVNSCIDSCNDDEDNQKQIACASTFKLWVLLKCKESSTALDDSKAQMRELLSIEQMLGSNAAHQKALWEGLLERFKVQSNGDVGRSGEVMMRKGRSRVEPASNAAHGRHSCSPQQPAVAAEQKRSSVFEEKSSKEPIAHPIRRKRRTSFASPSPCKRAKLSSSQGTAMSHFRQAVKVEKHDSVCMKPKLMGKAATENPLNAMPAATDTVKASQQRGASASASASGETLKANNTEDPQEDGHNMPAASETVKTYLQ